MSAFYLWITSNEILLLEKFFETCLFCTNNLPIAINITIDVRSGNFLKILGFYFLLYLTTEYYLLNNFPSSPVRACAWLTLILQREEESIYNPYELHCTRPVLKVHIFSGLFGSALDKKRGIIYVPCKYEWLVRLFWLGSR